MSDTEKIAKEPVLESIECRVCSGGNMHRAVIKPYNQNVGIILIIGGLLGLVTGVLAFLGLIALLVGISFMTAKKDVWLCDKCRAIVERI